MRIVLVLVFAFAVGAPSAQAQQPADSTSSHGRAEPVAPTPILRGSVVFDVGGSPGGPSSDIETAMDDAGLGESFLMSHPHSERGVSFLVEAQYRISQPWSVGVLFGRLLNGSMHGYGVPLGKDLEVDYRVTSAAVLLSAGPSDFQIGLGPALHHVQSRPDTTSGSAPPPWADQWKVGFIAEARAMVPARSLGFLDLTVKYSFVGDEVVGPYSSGSDILGGPPATIPPTRVKFNHWFVGAGFGVRF